MSPVPGRGDAYFAESSSMHLRLRLDRSRRLSVEPSIGMFARDQTRLGRKVSCLLLLGSASSLQQKPNSGSWWRYRGGFLAQTETEDARHRWYDVGSPRYHLLCYQLRLKLG